MTGRKPIRVSVSAELEEAMSADWDAGPKVGWLQGPAGRLYKLLALREHFIKHLYTSRVAGANGEISSAGSEDGMWTGRDAGLRPEWLLGL